MADFLNPFQSIKNACEVDNLGDRLSPATLEAADDLYYLRIPRLWCKLAGDTMPPPNQALATWLTDLANRCQHFERILLLVSNNDNVLSKSYVLFLMEVGLN